VLDETCALEQPQRTASNASTATTVSQEPQGRLAKLKSKLGFGNAGEKDADGNAISRPTTNVAPQPGGREYTSNMVDVLDTVGMFTLYAFAELY
jgi:hypothetical protein